MNTLNDKLNGEHHRASSTSGHSSHKDPFAFSNAIDIQQVLNYLVIIRERWLWGMSAGILLAALFSFVMLRKAPIYEAESLLLIESKAAQIIDVKQVVDTNLENYWGESPELENHLRQMQSRSFLNDVASSFSEAESQLIIESYIPKKPDAKIPTAGDVLEKNVEILNDGQVFSIICRHQHPEAAALIADRYAAQYIASILTRSGVGNQSALDFLEQQVEELKEKISKAEKQLTDYRSQNNLVSLEENQNIIVERLKAINAEKTRARMEQLQLESTVEQVETAIANNDDLTEIPVISNYGSIQDIMGRKKEFEATKAELNLRYMERHPKMIEVEKMLTQVEEQLNGEIDRAVRDLINQKDAVDRQITRLIVELQAAEQEAFALDQQGVEYNVLKRQLDSDRLTFDQIINRLNETALSAKLDTTNFRILDEAAVPQFPVEPNKKKIAMAAILLFLVGLAGLPLLVEAIDNRLKSAYDVESFIGKPLLADLPFLRKLASQECSPNAVLENIDDSIIEGFRSAYSSLQMHSQAKIPKVVLITSTSPSEGKSFVASNLTACMSKHGLKCLLIDTDFRRPSLHRHFDLKNDKGIISWHESLINRHHAFQSDDSMTSITQSPHLGIKEIAENFHFLRAGGSTKRTTELIDSLAFERLMNSLRQTYDIIILDTPPVSVFTDSLFLAEFADEVIYVAKYNEVSRQKVRHFIHKLDGHQHNKVVGMIINSRTSAKGQRYGYDYSYSYYSSDYKYYKRYAENVEEEIPVAGKQHRSRRSVKTKET